MRTYLKMAMMAAGLCLGVQAAQAQTAIEGRVGRLESEMRAVQRKVFPGGSGQYVQPENAPAPADIPGSPSSSPVADLDTRVAALESQMTGMTGQIETTQHKLQLIEDAFNAYKRSTDARLKALEEGASSTGPAPTPSASNAAPSSTRPSATKPATATAKPTPAKDSVRAQMVSAVEKPSPTADPAEDAYLYGYRLWQAKLYPEAEAQLKSVVTTYPKHKRASYAQNLLGRSYLDEGRPSLAAFAFYENYHSMPGGDRAPESLYYLGRSLTKLGKLPEACKVYGELTGAYAEKISDTMKADIAHGRTDAKCKPA